MNKKLILGLVIISQTMTTAYGNNIDMVIINNTQYPYQIQSQNQTSLSYRNLNVPAYSITKPLKITFSGNSITLSANNISYNAPSQTIAYQQTFYSRKIPLIIAITKNGQLQEINPQNQPALIINNATENELLLQLNLSVPTVKPTNYYSDQQTVKINRNALIFYKIPAQQVTTIARPDLQVTVNQNLQEQPTVKALQTFTAKLEVMLKEDETTYQWTNNVNATGFETGKSPSSITITNLNTQGMVQVGKDAKFKIKPPQNGNNSTIITVHPHVTSNQQLEENYMIVEDPTEE